VNIASHLILAHKSELSLNDWDAFAQAFYRGISNKPRSFILCEKKLHKRSLIKLSTQARWSHSQSHAIMGFCNLCKQKHFTDSPLLLFTQYETTRLTIISIHCLAASPTKDVWGQQQSHAEKCITYRNLKLTFEDSLPCYCYATTRNSRTMRSQVSQCESAGEEMDMS